jgi:hypothetical protein
MATDAFQGSGSLFTDEMLAKYDGSDPKLPIYLAVGDDIPYHILAC